VVLEQQLSRGGKFPGAIVGNKSPEAGAADDGSRSGRFRDACPGPLRGGFDHGGIDLLVPDFLQRFLEILFGCHRAPLMKDRNSFCTRSRARLKVTATLDVVVPSIWAIS